MEAKFTEHGVVPDVIDTAPKEAAKVTNCHCALCCKFL